MKKKWIVLLFTSLIISSLSAQTEKVKWDYPVKPGTEEWASFTTGQQMVDACQVPNEILEELSTRELIEICMNYPMLFIYTASNDERAGISYMVENFTGFKELSKRKDGLEKLITVYKNYPVLTEVQNKLSKDFSTPYKLPFLELLLSDDNFTKQLDAKISVDLGKLVLDKYERKLENTHVYSLYNVARTLLLGAIVMSKQQRSELSQEQKNTIKSFIDNYSNAEPTLLTDISKIISDL
jgi:hypothetical protein